jgi:hypothetical protein
LGNTRRMAHKLYSEELAQSVTTLIFFFLLFS